jgi:hypothetical protein
MFQNFSFSHKNNITSTLTSNNEDIINDMDALSNPTNLDVVDDIASTTTETMIVGHKLSYAHELVNEPNVLITEDYIDNTASNETGTDGIHDKALNHVDDGDEEGSILSVEVDDLSGSILENLPSTKNHDNINRVDNSIEDDNDDDIGNDRTTTGMNTDTTFHFEPIVQAMQELQYQSKNSAHVIQFEGGRSDDKVHLATSSLQNHLGHPNNLFSHRNSIELTNSQILRQTNTPKTSIKTSERMRETNRGLNGRIVWRLSLVLAAIAFWWVPKYSFVTDDHHEMTKNQNLHDSTNSVSRTQSIPVPSPIFALLQTEKVVVNNSQVHVPTFVRITHSIEPTIVTRRTDDTIDGVGNADSSSTPLAVNSGPMTSLSNVPQFWLPHQIIDFIAAIRYFPTLVHRIVSMMIFTATIAVTGCVFVMLLANFFVLTWKKSKLSEGANEIVMNKTTRTVKHQSDEVNAKRNILSVASLCEFIQSTQFSRTGRRSRSPPSKAIKGAYNSDCYEQLSMDDLKHIGKFLGIPRLSKLQQKSNLINAIVAQYEILLQSWTKSDIKEVLSVMKMGNVAINNKKDLIKLAIEVGF